MLVHPSCKWIKPNLSHLKQGIFHRHPGFVDDEPPSRKLAVGHQAHGKKWENNGTIRGTTASQRNSRMLDLHDFLDLKIHFLGNL